jgi:GT2 family glycosyltransferase
MAMSAPDLVSIVIPAYNQARYLAQAVDSALAQTHAATEVIVVNDGSTDDTAGVLQQYAGDPRVTAITQENRGLPGARNRGLAAARGSFVVFLDSDDYLAPAHVATLVAPLLEDARLGMTYCDIVTVDPEGRPVGDFSVASARTILSGDIFDSLVIGGYFPPHTVVVRKAALDRVGGFDPALGGHADLEMWLRLAASGHPALFVSERLAHYRTSPDSMSRDTEHMRASRIAALERIALAYPARFAAAVSAVQELNTDLHAANVWLKEQWAPVVRRLDAAQGAHVYSLVDHFGDAQRVGGREDQAAVWDVTIDSALARSIYLHPASELRWTVPIAGPGRLVGAVAMHPDVWTNPETGVVDFRISVDGTAGFSAVLDVVKRPADRRWLEFSFEVPAAANGPHEVSLATRALGRDWFCWALIRNPQFFS